MSLYFKGFLRHTTPHFMAYLGDILFANMGGGGGQNCFHEGDSIADIHLSSADSESGNATGAFLQTPGPVLDKVSGSHLKTYLFCRGATLTF